MTTSTLCPFCNTRHAAAPGGQAGCPSSGPGAAPARSVTPAAPARPAAPVAPDAAMQDSGRTIDEDWDGPELGGSLELSPGGSIASAGAASAYAASPASFGDDDPFADDVPAASFELDVPAGHAANAPRAASGASGSPPAASRSALESGVPAVPDLALPSAPQSAPALAAPPSPQSAPALAAPPPPPSDPALAAPSPPSSDPALAAPSPPSSDPALARPAARPTAPPDPAALIARYPAPPTQVWGAPAYAMNVLWRQFELRQDLASLRKRRSPDVPLFERALRVHDRRMFTLGLAISCAGFALAVFVFFLPVIARFARAP